MTQDQLIARFTIYIYWNSEIGAYFLNMTELGTEDIRLTSPGRQPDDGSYQQALEVLEGLVTKETRYEMVHSFMLPGVRFCALLVGFIAAFAPFVALASL